MITFCIGEERIYLHLFNKKKFFRFFENKADGLASGQCSTEDILHWAKKGEAWEPMVDEDWKPMAAKEIPILTEYVKMMICQPDIT